MGESRISPYGGGGGGFKLINQMIVMTVKQSL